MIYRLAVLALLLTGASLFVANALPDWMASGRPDPAAPAAISVAQEAAEAVVATREPELITPRPLGGRVVEIIADRSGHFQVEAEIEGRRIDFLVDTGATYIALNATTARRLNIRPLAADYNVQVGTANGVTMVAPVRLDQVRIDNIVVRDVWALVHRDDSPDVNLLGMNFLSELRSFEMRGDRLTLSQ